MKRLVAAFLLISLVLLLTTYHYQNHDQYEAYPGNEAVIAGTVGTVSVYGTVIATGDGTFTLRLTQGSASKVVQVVSSISVASGDKVEILGVIQGDELIPEKIIVSKACAYYAIYVRSLLGLVLVVFVFFRYWSFDVRCLRFTKRREKEEKEHA